MRCWASDLDDGDIEVLQVVYQEGLSSGSEALIKAVYNPYKSRIESL